MGRWKRSKNNVSFWRVVAAERFGVVSPGCTVLADAPLFEVIMVSAALPRQECG
jgi:hypothetical protein